MRFTPATATLVLASTALAAPQIHRHEELRPRGIATGDLSVTHQLMLSELAADRFEILNKDEDFKFSLSPGDVPEGQGGVLKAANRKTFPALVGTGAAMSVGVIKPCGVNTFHVHPRSAELQLLISGTLTTEMVPENGARPIRNTLSPLDVTPFYQGSVHHQFNPKCEDAVFVAAFASEDPGTGSVVNSVFELDQGAITDTFGGMFEGETVAVIKSRLPASVVQGVETCLKECGGERDEGEGKDDGDDEEGKGK